MGLMGRWSQILGGTWRAANYDRAETKTSINYLRSVWHDVKLHTMAVAK